LIDEFRNGAGENMKAFPVRCSKCQVENQKARKFCRECGERLLPPCPRCGFGNHQGDKFCGDCGQSLSPPSEMEGREPTSPDLSWDEKLAKIQKYLPKGLTEKILAQKDKIEGERKQVTVMFCDLVGFTSISEKLGHEEAYALIDRIMEILIHQVHAYEGTVNKMTGDGIMALFGAPIALEDAPQRALRSALAISREMNQYAEKGKREKGTPPVQMRIGIHTGPVVVGTLGSDLRVEFSAVGDTVNLASRMEGLAEPGTILVSEETYRLTEGLFRFEPMGEKRVKGKENPIQAYRVVAPRSSKTRFEVSAEKGLTCFVGRERELEVLRDGFERAREGRGQVFSVVAEAGVGKSRLLHEFRKALAKGDLTILEGKCLSYGRGMAYHPLVEILKSSFEIQEGEEESGIRRKLKEGLKTLEIDEGVYLPFLLELFSVKDSGIEKIPLSPDARKERIMEAFKRVLLKLAAPRPLVIAFEDLHWLDKSSEETLRSFLEIVPGARIQAVFTYRPEFVPPWAFKSYHSQVTLNRLSNRETLAMVSHLLETRTLSQELEELILVKTEGVPLFVEEFIRSFRDLKIMVRRNHHYQLARNLDSVAIPSTIQEVIMARVDSLPEGARDLLQTASVIDREFSHELIKRASTLPEPELLSRLSILKNAELLYEKDIYPQSTYVFRHALTREVVYDSLLSRRKKQLHDRIAKVMEQMYRHHLSEHSDVLAEHFIKSENFEKGAEFAQLAGKKARKRSAYGDAISYSYKELFCLEKVPDSPAVQKKIMDARVALANYCMNLNEHVEAYEAVSPIADLALRLNYRKRLPAIYTAIGSYLLFVEEDYPQGMEYLHQALEFSEEVKDFFSLWNACYLLGTALSWNCEFQKALDYFQKSLDLSLAARNPMGIAAAKINMGVSYILQGKVDQARQVSREALAIAEETGDIYIKGMAHSCYGSTSYYQGLFEEAEDHLLRGIGFCENSTHFTWGSWASAFLGDMYFDLRRYDKSIEAYQKAFSFLEKRRFGPSWLTLAKVAITRARVVRGDSEISLNEVLKFSGQNKNRGFAGWIAQYTAETLFHLGDSLTCQAQSWAEKAIELDRQNGTRLLLGRDYLLSARIWNRTGNPGKAREDLIQAIEIFQQCGAAGYLKRASQELGLLTP
jgi:class 3 adenylate cyclase/tetratricopeptide (TPR) repeat protein